MSQNWREQLLRLDRDVTPQRAAARWGGDLATVGFASLRANAVFRFVRAGQGAYLRLIHAGLRGVEAVEPVVEFAAHLAAESAPISAPIRSDAGRWIEEIEQGDDVFIASVYREVPGRPLDRSCQDPGVFEAWGRALAAMHTAAVTFDRVDPSPFRSIHGQWQLVRERLADETAALREDVDRIDAWLSTLSEASDFGLTHGDCNATNFIWDGRSISVIDFDDPMYHWFAADVARPFREFPADRPQQRAACTKAMLAGYRSVRSLSEDWERRLPWWLRLIDLDLYAWARKLPEGTLLPGDQKRENALAQLRRNLGKPLPE